MTTYKESSSEDEEENFEDGLDFEDPLETVETEIRRRSLEAQVSQTEQILNQTLHPDPTEAPPTDHFSPVRVTFPVNAPALRPPINKMVNYDEQVLPAGEAEDDKALDNAIRSMQRLEFDELDLPFFFQQAELKMKAAAVKAQYTKFQALTAILPKKVQDQVKSLLRKQETELGNTPYKTLKNKILQVFGQPSHADFERAMSRVLSGKPSQLCREIIDDMCSHELTNCCCAKWVFGLWNRSLPTSCRQAIADMEFTGGNLEAILKLADSVFSANKPLAAQRIAAVSYITPTQTTSIDEAFHQNFESEGQVAALSYRGSGGRGGRGGGRGRGQNRGGNRGQQGRGGGRGQSSRGSGQNRGGGQSQGGGHPRHQGPRHADGPPLEVCVKHWVHGKSAHWCQEPGTCPWRDYYIPRANNQ